MNNENKKWWGWGSSDKSYDLSLRPFFWLYLKKRLDIPEKPFLFPPLLEEIDIPKCRLKEQHFDQLKRFIKDSQIHTSKLQRILHTYGKSYHDLIRIRDKQFPNVPDAIIYPESEDQITKLFEWADKNKVAIVPFGGGTSVVGGIEALSDYHHIGVVTLDLSHMNRVLHIEKKSLTADVQAGIIGPKLEEILQKQGFTLSHYPESFEFSSLGGWIAARSAGQQSTLYGKIEEMVESLRMITPSGILETPNQPAAAHGPDQKQLIIGSEGILGVITQARIRLKPLPERKLYTAFLIESFEAGVEICRKILQNGIKPATIRLSDEEETEFILSLRLQKSSVLANIIQEFGLGFAQKRGFSPGKCSFLLLGLEGRNVDVKHQWKSIRTIISSYHTFHLGEKVGQSWYCHRFENPYLRDNLLDYGILVETLETSTEWDNVDNLYNSVRNGILSALIKMKIKGVVTAHLSHLYPTGCSIYFIIIATPVAGEEIQAWKKIKRTASEAIIGAKGSISHHHGIGLDHRPWLKGDIGQVSVEWLRMLKQQVDPQNLLNPGKLLPEPSSKLDPFIQKMTSKEESLAFSAQVRREYVDKLQREQFDILVIGGGITGAGIIRDAVFRGYNTALIEKADFASGTSSKSAKLVHGGFRYLKSLEFGLVHEALNERKTLMDIAPHLVHSTQCLLPIYEDSSLPGWMVKLGMMLYDGLSFSKGIGTHTMIPAEKTKTIEPALRKNGLKKIALYYDAWADDYKLVIATIQSAVQNGGIAANYIKAIDVIQEKGKITGICARDEISGMEFPIYSRVIVNATGPWCDQLRQSLLKDSKSHLRTTKGIHLLIHKKTLPINHAIILSAIQDGRPIYAIPWREFVLLGTTDTDSDSDPDCIFVEKDEVQYLLDSFNHYFPKANLTEEKIISTFSGLRPLIHEEGKSASAVSRDYLIFEEPANFFTILGGKLTTYRTMAEEMVDQLAMALQSSFKISVKISKCRTHKFHLYGGDIAAYDRFSKEWTEQLTKKYHFDSDIAHNFIESYGRRIPELLQAIEDTTDGKDRILPKLPYVWGELTYSCRHEMTIALDDFLIRRTHLFPLDEDQALGIHEDVADRLAKYLGWSQAEKEAQIKRYKSKIDVIQHFRR